MPQNVLTVALEIKALKDRQFEGYGSTFGNVDLGYDIVIPGAFKRSLVQHKKDGTLPQMFWMHQPDKVPGKWLDMEEDKSGLYVKGELATTQLGDEMHTLLDMKAVRGLSIGFRVKDRDYDEEGHRLLKEIDLWEVSLVSLAMNPMAKVTGSKSRLSESGEYVPYGKEFKRNLEISLRDLGCSKRIALQLVSKLFDGETGEILELPLRDSDGEKDLTREEEIVIAKASELAETLELAGIAEKLSKVMC